MSEQYKYEPIFGDQSLFDGAPEDAVSVIYGKSEYIFDSEEIKATTGQLRDAPVVAMRRIIKVPTWTKADQLAGKLPKVGSLVKEKISNGFCGYECIVKCIFDGEICIQFDDGSFRIDTINGIEPIETPEEKAQRLEDEWVEKAYDDLLAHVGIHSTESPDFVKQNLHRIYNAMRSGELKAPEVE